MGKRGVRAFKDSDEWRLGHWGERLVRRWLEEQRYFVLPVNLIEDGGAPRLTAMLNQARVVPDFQVAGGGQMRWVEAKTKTRHGDYRQRHMKTHCVDLDNWRDYLAVEQVTGLPGHLAIVQLNPGPVLLFAAFHELEPYTFTGDTPNVIAKYGSAIAYWDVNRFRQYAIDPSEPAPVIEPRTLHPWENLNRRRGGGSVPPQQELFPW